MPRAIILIPVSTFFLLFQAERDLLAAGNVSRPYKQHKVEIEDGVHVHTVSFNAHEGEELTAADKDKKHLVLTHGYAAGTGVFLFSGGGLSLKFAASSVLWCADFDSRSVH
jgi:hypothetical protein